MKKLLACVLALVFVLGMTVTAFASNDQTVNGIRVLLTGNGAHLRLTADGVEQTIVGNNVYSPIILGGVHVLNVFIRGNDIYRISDVNVTPPGPVIVSTTVQDDQVKGTPVESSSSTDVTTHALTAATIGMHIHQPQGNQNRVTFGAAGTVVSTTVTTTVTTTTTTLGTRTTVVWSNGTENVTWSNVRNVTTEDTQTSTNVVTNTGVPVGAAVVYTRNNSADAAVVGPFRVNFETIGNTNVRALSVAAVAGSVEIGGDDVTVNVGRVTFSQPTWSMHNGRQGVSTWNPQGNVRNNPQPW